MRYFICAVLFSLSVCGLAFSQVTVVSGYASNYAAEPGSYAAPFIPRVVTPEAAFPTPKLEVGASNATEGNMAGASSAPATENSSAQSANLVVRAVSSTNARTEAQTTAPEGSIASAPGFESGASMPEDAFGLAQLARGRPASRPAVRKFTNSDIEKMHPATRQNYR
jgi:hypothetical protein